MLFRECRTKNGNYSLRKLREHRDKLLILIRVGLPQLKKVEMKTYEELIDICKLIHSVESKNS